MYAIIEDSGTQIKVSEGDVIKVALRDLADDVATVVFDKVLLCKGAQDAQATLGTPLVEGAIVTGDILSAEKGEKILITKFKRRKKYRRRNGHRQPFLQVKITSIKAA